MSFFFFFFVLLLKCPCVKLSVLNLHSILSCNITYFSLHTLTHIHTYTTTHKTLFCGCKCGSPWRRDHLDTPHDPWVSAHFIDAHTRASFIFLLIILFKWLPVAHDAQHITTIKPTTIVLVYKYIPFFQHKVYTFLSGWYFVYCTTSCWDNPGKITTSPPQRRVP